MKWDDITKEHESTMKYMDEWVYGVENREQYMKKLSAEKVIKLLPKACYSQPVSYGSV
jgi:glutaconate CoA-transferase subunit A